MKKILVTDPINEKGIKELEKIADVTVKTDMSQEELIDEIGKYNALVVRSGTKVTREVIEAGKNLEIIARAGVGVDNIDVGAATEKGIMVVNAPESTSITVAEHTMGLMLTLARKIVLADKSVRRGEWNRSKFMGIELKDKVLGIIGLGRIGSQVSLRARAFGMKILAYDPYIDEESAESVGATLVELDELLKKSDIVTIHVPLTKETKHLISRRELKMMKNSAYIINCARGGIIDEEALIEALENNEIAGAALDVFEEEPPSDSPLLEFDNVVLTPHIGASTVEAQRDAAIIVANEIKRIFDGKPPQNVINMPSLDRESFKLLKPYIELCEKMGLMITQLAPDKIKSLNVVYAGEISEFKSLDVLTRTLLQNILNPILTEPVNIVNAHTIAEKRGIVVTESRRPKADNYKSVIQIDVETKSEKFSIEGTYTNKPKIININGYKVDVEPKGNMMIVKYRDLPGTIGAIGTKLGEHDINIAIMQVGREKPGGEAVMVLKVDQKVPEDVLEEVKSLKNVEDAVFMILNN
ncbi:D-3-phosphoglycerate dehydrogenase [Methanothermus fervidus DSM 2088]|uniref:D-3-phosphoglycerate dehydrogenase n=1 Tax=Methanothermus fervidus (strain ATCC 43054 / DSM 2088 / JCM 10308 / V24 S) TaxID=523846 RepID=E3GZB1_METFV|nr:phosphoglycerate dehydrogenase [Methanothermus fervidus]ADP77643.1 D-3-phosphoglycerate dehydrogenase [Methanothermus fervidus DSM 2088]